MFEKKDCVVTSALGVCVVADVPKLAVGKEQQMQYYLLRALQDKNKKSYIPVENHQTVIRFPMEAEEARDILDKLLSGGSEFLEKEEAEKMPLLSCGKEWLASTNPLEWAKATVYLLRNSSVLDQELREDLEKAWRNLSQELAYVLEKEQEEIRQQVENTVKYS